MKNLRLALALSFISLISCSSQESIIKSISDEGTHLKVVVESGEYRIKAYGSKIMETSFIPSGEVFNSLSHAVVLEPVEVKTTLVDKENFVEYSTSGVAVVIRKDPFQISYTYKGEQITSEKGGYARKDSLETIQFNLDEEEVLYGGGARALGMNRRGNRLVLYNKAHYGYETRAELMNYSMPIVISSKKYMLHFDNAPIGYLDLDSENDNTLTYETISGRKTYQIIVGDTWLDLIDNYTNLTGKQPLPPRWALGNFSSRFGYHSEKETRNTIDAFIKDEIPVDAVILDLFWFGKPIQGTLGNFEFLKDSFPTPKKMIADFKEKGVKTILITEPYVLETSKKWQEAVSKEILATNAQKMPYVFEFYFGKGGIIDIYKEGGKQWFWDVYKRHIDMGISGWWGDLGEPERHPSYVQHAIGSADEVHNIYGHDWAKLVYEGYQKYFPEQRPFILMRAGSSGSQRFGLIPWSGDVNRSWGGLQSQTEIALQMGMQGLGYMHSDLGGFAGGNPDNELYTRWLQYGVFQPIYRPHAQEEVPSEPVFREPKTKALVKQAIELRYKMLPYNYTLAFDNNQTGAPLMRPLFFEDETSIDLSDFNATYLWGKDFLVTPILNPSVTRKEVYFPKSAIWFDFYTDEKIEGGQTKNVTTTENAIPTYVRGGAFVPLAKPMRNTSQYDATSFDLHYYHDTSVSLASGKLYHDDGLTPNAFEKGMYEIIHFNSKFEEGQLQIQLNAEIGEHFSSSSKKIDVVVHNVILEPSEVLFDSKKVKFDFDETNKTLTIVGVVFKTVDRKSIHIKM